MKIGIGTCGEGGTMQITLTAFEVINCGYHLRSRKKGIAPAAFYSLESAISDLSRWVGPIELKDTLLRYGSQQKDLYCSEIKLLPSDTFISIWVGSDLVHGSELLTINPKSKINSPQISINQTNGNIPGFPAFFWIPKNKKLIVAIRPDGYPISYSSIDFYLGNFLKFKSPRVVHDDDDNDDQINIAGYLNDSGVTEKAYPRFEKTYAAKKGYIAALRSKITRIRKVHTRNTIQYPISTKGQPLQLLTALFNGMGISVGQHHKIIDEIPVDYTLNYTPTTNEFNEMLTKYHSFQNDTDDIGFTFQNETGVSWISHSKVKETYDISLTGKNSAHPNLDTLIPYIQKIGNAFLDTIDS